MRTESFTNVLAVPQNVAHVHGTKKCIKRASLLRYRCAIMAAVLFIACFAGDARCHLAAIGSEQEIRIRSSHLARHKTASSALGARPSDSSEHHSQQPPSQHPAAADMLMANKIQCNQ